MRPTNQQAIRPTASLNLRQLFLWHLAFCVLYYWVRELLNNRSLEYLSEFFDFGSLALSAAHFVILFVFALVPYLILRRYADRPRYELAGWLFLASLIAIGFRYLVEEVIAPVTVGFRNYPPGTSLLTYYLDNLYYLFLHGGLGAIVFLLQSTREREAQRQALVVENQRTELAFLRSQINPHFLFNTLNNVYSLFFQKSDKALRAIERLTVMLRYGLYEKEEFVPLTKEVEHLLNFIELEKLRYEPAPEVDLQLPGEELAGVSVPPLLLITFVENAFKHGDMRQPLSITLCLENGRLLYRVVNTPKPHQQKDAVGGIGLANLRKRLALIYGDRATLSLDAAPNQHTASLNIEL